MGASRPAVILINYMLGEKYIYAPASVIVNLWQQMLLLLHNKGEGGMDSNRGYQEYNNTTVVFISKFWKVL